MAQQSQTNFSAIEVFKGAFRVLVPAEKRVLAVGFVATLLQSLIEVVGIAAIMPFLVLVAKPALIHENPHLNRVFQLSGLESERDFLIAVAAFGIGINVFRNVTQTWAIAQSHKVIGTLGASLSTRLLTLYLRKPYAFFLQRNSTELQSNVFHDAPALAADLFVAGTNVVVHSFVALLIVLLVVLVDPLSALLVAAVAGGTHGIVYAIVRRRVLALALGRRRDHKARTRAVAEAMLGIKDVKIRGLEDKIAKRFYQLSHDHFRANTLINTIGQVPRYTLDTIAFSLCVLVLLIPMLRGEDAAALLPRVGLYTLAGYRLMPKLQLIFFSLTRLRNGAVTLDRLRTDLETTADLEEDAAPVPEPQKSIRLDAVTFRYETATTPALDGVTIDIPVRTSVGIVGTTGSGKTTAIDVLTGLLLPQSGTLVLDGKPLDRAGTIAWRRRVGYVPQAIYLTDTSVLANIAFGVPADEVDRAAVERAARIANIHDFVVRDLPNGYDTVVGDRGVRLSGGQRQRIGIARALYHDPAVLIFDEATSAVDNVTERSIIDAIDNIASQRTIVIIAHRLETVRNCDHIFILDQGKVQASGTFDELFSHQPAFQRLVRGELAVSGE